MQTLQLFSGSAVTDLAQKIAQVYGKELSSSTLQYFSDGEFQPTINESVRGNIVAIIQSTFSPADNLLELLLTIDAAKRAAAKQIIAVMPYIGLSRQDRKGNDRTAIGAKLIANLLVASGANQIITIDLHADQMQGFFDVPVENLYASNIFIPYIEGLQLENMVIAAPDVGGSKRSNSYAKYFDVPLVIGYKQRKMANVIERMEVIGDVEGKHVLIIDDMVDTAGTITKAAEIMKEKGATSIRVFCTHAILSGNAYEKIENSALTELIVTDSIPLKKIAPKIKVLSVAPLIANALHKIHTCESINTNFLV